MAEYVADSTLIASVTDDGQSNSKITRKQQLPRPPGNPKLEELKHDFQLLAEKIQGSSHSLLLKPPPPTEERSRLPCPRNGTEPPLASPERRNPTLRRNIKVSKIVMMGGSVARGKNEGSELASSSHYDQHAADAENLERIRVAAYTEGRGAAEAAARFANQALKGLKEELEAERRCRAAAERALRDSQRRAADSKLECARLARVVNSFGGRSLEEITSECTTLAKRAGEAECSLQEAHGVADTKARETVEALERAVDLAHALEKEKTARVAAENARKSTAQDLRLCLRRSAKAEEGASVSARSLAKSEAQLESLTQRLGVLRTANHRLEKRLANSTGAAEVTAGLVNTNVGDRLAAARARLRTLPTAKVSSDAGGGGCGDDRRKGDADGERAAAQRVMRVVNTNKKWKEKLREADARGEMYKSAAEASEIGMQELVRDKADLLEVNRILGKRLTELLGEAPVEDTKKDENNQIRENAMFASRGEGEGMKTTGTQRAASGLTATVGNTTGSPNVCDTATKNGTGPGQDAQRNIASKQYDNAHCVGSPTMIYRSSEHTNADMVQSGISVSPVLPASGTQLPQDAPSALFSRPVVGGSANFRRRPRPWLHHRSASEPGPLPSHRSHPDEVYTSGSKSSASSKYPYERLLLESRQLREDALCVVNEGPWCVTGGGDSDDDDNEIDVSTFGTLPNNRLIHSVPVEVLLRLCERSARGGMQCTMSKESGNADECAENVMDISTLGEHDFVCEGLRRVSHADDGLNVIEDTKKLPPGLSAALAEQVQGAVSRGDERRFLQIVGQCGESARGGIAQLVLNREPFTQGAAHCLPVAKDE